MNKRLDRLSALIDRFRIEAVVLPLDRKTEGNLFVLVRSISRLSDDMEPQCLVFRPGGFDEACRGGEIAVAARVDLGGASSPLALALPDEVRVDLEDAPALAAVADVLLEEALRPRCGGQAIVDRLSEIVVVRLLRHAIEHRGVDGGLIAGLGHPQLAAALVAIHEAPERPWRLEDLARTAGMSRTAFATTFHTIVGRTPGAYLQDWRLSVARQEISRGVPMKTVAGRVGFGSAAAFSRAYHRAYGHVPSKARAHAR